MKVHLVRTKNLTPILIILIYAFKIIGLAPFSLQRSETPVGYSRSRCRTGAFLFSKVGQTYNILLYITVQVVGGLAIPRLYAMTYSYKTSITQAIDVAQGILRTSTICITILTWILKQRNAVSIVNRLLKVDYLLSALEKHPSSEWKSFMSVAAHMIFNTLLWVVFVIFIETNTGSIPGWFILYVPRFITHWFIMQYFIVLEVLARKIKRLNQNLLDFKEFPNYPCRTQPLLIPVLILPNFCSQLSDLELLHSIRTTLSEVSREVADFFSFPLLFTVACLFLTIVVNVYYFVTPLIISKSELQMSTVINNGVWVLMCVYALVLLSSSVENTLKEANLTGLVVHKLLATSRRQEIQTVLERFSLQLIHEDLRFTACGFFSLDFTLIHSILGVTATYLVIIIQFIQSATTATDDT